MIEIKSSNSEKEGPNKKENNELTLLEKKFNDLSKRFIAEKEAYDKEVFEIKEQIKKLEEEISELEKEEVPEKETIDEPTDIENLDEPESKNLEKELLVTENETEKIIDKTIENLPEKEADLLGSEMEKSKPLSFENPKVKTNLKTFLQNQIVKSLSGFKISGKIKEIVRKSTKYFLLTGVISTLWITETGGADVYQDNLNKNHDITLLTKDALEKSKPSVYHPIATTESGEYQILPENVQNIYSYAMENIKDSYLIIDKPSATMYVINENKELVATLPVLLGQTKGESKNLADPESDIAVNATTPAGKYILGEIGHHITKEDSLLYQGRMISLLGSGGLAIHMTYPLDFLNRTHALNSSTVDDNRKSWGCINISPENFDKYIRPYFNKKYQTLFILPDNPALSINPSDGKIIEAGNVKYFASNIEKEISKQGIKKAKGKEGGKYNKNHIAQNNNINKRSGRNI